MNLYGISGKRESGKSTLAKFLEQHGFIRVSLANPLKEMVKELYGFSDEQVYGNQKETPTQYRRTDGSFFTPRDILIREGCLKRSIDPLFWCKKLVDRLEYLSKDSTAVNFVIDDIRFLNEIDFFKPMGAKFIRIEREASAIGKAALDDLSETELDAYKAWDFKLEADGNKTLEDLQNFAAIIANCK